MRLDETKLVPYLDTIRALDFVKGLELKQVVSQRDLGLDGLMIIATSRGKFSFGIEQKGSYLELLKDHFHGFISSGSLG